jgi:hypothetical protein
MEHHMLWVNAYYGVPFFVSLRHKFEKKNLGTLNLNLSNLQLNYSCKLEGSKIMVTYFS